VGVRAAAASASAYSRFHATIGIEHAHRLLHHARDTRSDRGVDERGDLVSLTDQSRDCVAADGAGSAGDEHLHAIARG